MADYRADPGLNQSLLKKFLEARTPAHFKWDQEHGKEPDTDALRIGTAVDWLCFDLSQEHAMHRIAVWQEERRQGNAWKAFKIENIGKLILTIPEMSRVIGATEALKSHPDASRWIKSSEHQVVIIAEHPDFHIRMKGLLDMMPDNKYGWVGDLKTAEDASPAGFSMNAWRMGYHIQAAYYLDLLKFAGMPVEEFGFVIVENEPYHGITIQGMHCLSAEVQLGRTQYEAALVKLAQCRAQDIWPAYDAQWTKVLYKPWQLNPKAEVQVIA